VAAEVAHRPLPVRKQLCRQPVPHAVAGGFEPVTNHQ
jgi:hypothetical protein